MCFFFVLLDVFVVDFVDFDDDVDALALLLPFFFEVAFGEATAGAAAGSAMMSPLLSSSS